MKMLDYIFVDLDGPILEGKFRHYNCYRDIIHKDGGIPLDVELYWSMKRKMIKRDIILTKSHYQAGYEQFMQQWLENIEKREYLQFDYLKPNIRETLESWNQMAKQIVLITMRNHRENLLYQLRELKILNTFAHVVSCSSKGDRGIKYEALKEWRFNSALFIGDTEEDIISARKLGVKVVAITNGLREKVYLDADFFAKEICDINMRQIVTML